MLKSLVLECVSSRTQSCTPVKRIFSNQAASKTHKNSRSIRMKFFGDLPVISLRVSVVSFSVTLSFISGRTVQFDDTLWESLWHIQFWSRLVSFVANNFFTVPSIWECGLIHCPGHLYDARNFFSATYKAIPKFEDFPTLEIFRKPSPTLRRTPQEKTAVSEWQLLIQISVFSLHASKAHWGKTLANKTDSFLCSEYPLNYCVWGVIESKHDLSSKRRIILTMS